MPEALAPEEFTLISGLFARAPMFVSACDNSDLDQTSEEEEKAAMLRALRRVGKIAKCPLITKAALEAISSLTIPDAETAETLKDDIRRAANILKAREALAELQEFRKALLYVSTMVARAYREELDHHEDEFILESFLTKISGYLNQEADPQEFKNENVSSAEDSALTMISEGLRV